MVQSQVGAPDNARRQVLAVLLGSDLGRWRVLALLTALLMDSSPALLLLGEFDH